MSTIITSIDKRSPAARAGVLTGEKLLAINGHEIVDVLDYRYYGYDANPTLALESPEGAVRTVRVRKPETEDLGINF